MTRISWFFNPLSIALITTVVVVLHWKYTADAAANAVGGLVAYIMFPGLLYFALLPLSVYTARYFGARYVGLDAIFITIGFFVVYVPGIVILLHVFYLPV